MYKNNFKNEIDNKITVKNKNVKDNGVSYKTGVIINLMLLIFN